MMRSPPLSRRSLIAPVILRRVASGLMIDKVRSMVIRISLFSSGLSLPARCGLLPIGQIAPGFAGTPPTAARCLDRVRVVAVEDIGAAGERLEILDFETVDQNDHRSAVRVLGVMREPERLHRRVAVARRTVRQERCLLVAPKRRGEVFDPLGRTGPHHHAGSRRPAPPEKLRPRHLVDEALNKLGDDNAPRSSATTDVFDVGGVAVDLAVIAFGERQPPDLLANRFAGLDQPLGELVIVREEAGLMMAERNY